MQKKQVIFSQISTANAPITNLFELQIQKSISKMVDFFVCEKISLKAVLEKLQKEL